MNNFKKQIKEHLREKLGARSYLRRMQIDNGVCASCFGIGKHVCSSINSILEEKTARNT